MMAVRYSAVGLLICLVVLACASAQQADPPPAAIPVDEAAATYRFGAVFEGETVIATFLIRNPSPFRLIIDEVETPCGCTTAQLAGQELKPQGEILVRVSLSTARLWGPQSKMVILHTNSPYRPRIKLLLEGVVRERLQLEPRRINVETTESSFHTTVRLTNVTDKPMQIESVSSEPAELLRAALDATEMPVTMAPGASLSLVVDAQLDHVGAQLIGTVSLHLAGWEEPARLPVFVERNQ